MTEKEKALREIANSAEALAQAIDSKKMRVQDFASGDLITRDGNCCAMGHVLLHAGIHPDMATHFDAVGVVEELLGDLDEESAVRMTFVEGLNDASPGHPLFEDQSKTIVLANNLRFLARDLRDGLNKEQES